MCLYNVLLEAALVKDHLMVFEIAFHGNRSATQLDRAFLNFVLNKAFYQRKWKDTEL